MKSYFIVTSVFILAIFIFMSGCSIRRIPDNSAWEEEYSENYYWSDGGYSGEMPASTPDYIEAWRMSKYYEYSDSQNYRGVYNTEGIWHNDKTPSDNTAQKSKMANQPRKISTEQAPEKRSAQSLSTKRKARLNKKNSKDKLDKDSEESDEKSKLEEQRRKLREKMRRTRSKEKPEEEDDASNNQRREKRLKDRK